MAEPVIEKTWYKIAEKIAVDSTCRTIFLIGECDTGKSTLAHFLVKTLCRTCNTGYVDCDPGQSVLGTPATLGLGLFNRAETGSPINVAKPDAKYLKFVGSNTPVKHMLENVTGVKKLLEKAYQAGAEKVVIDSCGFVQNPSARNFQHHCLDLSSPDLIIELHREYTLRHLLLNFSHAAEIISLSPSPAVSRKEPETRKANRQEMFRQYFTRIKPSILDIHNIGLHGRLPDFRNKEAYCDLLIGLCNKNRFVVVIGIVADINLHTQQMEILSPPYPAGRISSVHFGSLYCSPTGQHHNRD